MQLAILFLIFIQGLSSAANLVIEGTTHFGKIESTSWKMLPFLIKNPNRVPVDIQLKLSNSKRFKITTSSCGNSILPRGACWIKVRASSHDLGITSSALIVLGRMGSQRFRASAILTATFFIRPDDVFVPVIPNEPANMTTDRLQDAITQASFREVGVRLQPQGIYSTDRALQIVAPGPQYIDGADATLVKIKNRDAVMRIESVQEGFSLRNLKILASDGAFSQNQTLCSVQWPKETADYGIVVNGGRGILFSRLWIQNTSRSAVYVEPIANEISDLTMERLFLKYNGEGIRINGNENHHVRSVRVFGTQISLTHYRGISLNFVDDLTWQGGAIEKSNGENMEVNDSNRIEFFSYTENYGGWQIASYPYNFCPRDASANAIRLSRTIHFRFRGRIGDEERERGAGPIARVDQSECYQIASKGALLLQDSLCTGTEPFRPVLNAVLAAKPLVKASQAMGVVVIYPSDSPAVVLEKFRIAALSQPRRGIELIPAAKYHWPMIELTGHGDTPAFIQGQGASISLLGSGAEKTVEAVLKMTNPHNFIGSTGFYITDLAIKSSGARYGILITGAQGITLNRITISDAKEAGVRGEGKPGFGFYYNSFSNLHVTNSPKGVDIESVTNEKYANANFIHRLTALSVTRVLSLNWTSSTVLSQINADWRALSISAPRFLIDTSYSSDVELRRVRTPGTQPTNGLVKVGVEGRGINVDFIP